MLMNGKGIDLNQKRGCKLSLERSLKAQEFPYRSGRSRHWIKSKNPKHPAVKRKAEEDWRA
jgi:hypothetical protein